MTVLRATATAPVNIAVVKYWGKRDVKLNLATNDSLSVTLDQDDLRALTTASCSESFDGRDRMWLNGSEKEVAADTRLTACLKELRALRSELESSDSSLPKASSWPLRIASENNFPTAAGLASSAAGFAALVRAVADLYSLPHSAEQLSIIARQGSGSACRSLMGGYVAWTCGFAEDGTDSRAELIADRDHWPEMRGAILVASARKKDVSSTAGMQATVATSTLFAGRVREVVPAHMAAMRRAVQTRDFTTFAEVTMRDSNSFHSTCSDTYPPIFYMNDTSRLVCRIVERLNQTAGRTVAAYTFDAGPNAVLYYLAADAAVVLGFLQNVCQGVSGYADYVSKIGIDLGQAPTEDQLPESLASAVNAGITRFIGTQVGDGPRQIDDSQSLLNDDGLPKKVDA